MFCAHRQRARSTRVLSAIDAALWDLADAIC